MWTLMMKLALAFVIIENVIGYNFNLCAYLIKGGECATACQHEAKHAWGIPLCMHSDAAGTKCCIPSDHPLLQRRAHRTTTTTISTTTVAMATSRTDPEDSCGRMRAHSRIRRVVGGSRAPVGTWPWQAALRLYTGQYVCGAVVISDNWVLTAAHCLQPLHDDINRLRVYVGDQTLSYGREGRDNFKTIRRIIRHEDFQQNVAVNVTDPQTGETTTIRRHVHDIALVQLNESLSISDSVRPICLPETDENASTSHDDTSCWVAGWGENHENTYRSTDDLYEVRGHSLDHHQCGSQWGTVFDNDVVCFSSEGRGPCQGDSGGGMICRRSDGRYTLAGIISWGREDCLHDDHPSVLTKVSTYRYWIDSQVQNSTD